MNVMPCVFQQVLQVIRKQKVERFLRGCLATFLMFILVFSNIADLLNAPPKIAHAAAYSGKHLRTVEFVLGGGAGSEAMQTGTLTTSQTDDVNIYAGSAWDTTKGSAGTKTITIPGTGIKVLSAYLDTTFNTITSANVTDLELALDVSPGLNAGFDTTLDAVGENSTALRYRETSGQEGIINAKADATALFQTQTDSQWNSGLSIVGMLSVDGPTINLATMKLIITYEQA